jgi:hypothetical protein
MPTVIKPKRSEVSGAPTSGDLEVGEIAMNLDDKLMYSKKTDGTVVTIGTTETPVFFSDSVDLGNLSSGATEYDMGALS